jgi:hypothetical protein
MIYPLVRELADDEFSVRLTCRVLKFSTQGYYRWAWRPISYRDYENAYLTNALVGAHRKDAAFGYRFLADELERKGIAIGERRVWRLCSQALIWASFVKKPRSSKKSGPPVHDDLVLRNFSAKRAKDIFVEHLYLEHVTQRKEKLTVFQFAPAKHGQRGHRGRKENYSSEAFAIYAIVFMRNYFIHLLRTRLFSKPK